MKKHLLLAATLAAAACGAQAQNTAASATLRDAQGQPAGQASFTAGAQGLQIKLEAERLSPGEHGFHVHEKGDCSAPDFSSAGGHFNPSSQPHGDPTAGAHHVGDMPVLVADASGKATARAELRSMTIGGDGASDIVGKSVVVHADPDDFRTQPAGNSGARVACGVIK